MVEHVGLNFANFEALVCQYGEIVLCLQCDNLQQLVGHDKTTQVTVVAEEDPRKIDHVDEKEIGALEAMHKVGGIVPN